eukprot:364916-Chlamydomonas_euryale.AAC.10
MAATPLFIPHPCNLPRPANVLSSARCLALTDSLVAVPSPSLRCLATTDSLVAVPPAPPAASPRLTASSQSLPPPTCCHATTDSHIAVPLLPHPLLRPIHTLGAAPAALPWRPGAV